MLDKVLATIRVADPKRFAKLPTHAVVAGIPDDEVERLERKLLHVGQPAPGFVLRTPEGCKLSLEHCLEGADVLILTFWRYGSITCRQGMRFLQAVYAHTHGRGLNALAVNHGDEYATIARFVRESRLTLPIVEDGEGENDASAKYGVHVFPTTYVISPDGHIAARFVGFDEDVLRHAIEHLGLHVPRQPEVTFTK